MNTHADNLAAALREVTSYLEILNDVSQQGLKIRGSAQAAINQSVAMLEAHAAHTFADACHELADRARAVSDGNPGLWMSDRDELRQLEMYAHSVGDAADSLPDLYVEPRA